MIAYMRSHEVTCRLALAYIAVIVGTIYLLNGMMNATADGEPFSYPIFNLMCYAIPSPVLLIYMMTGRNYRWLSWLATAFCIFWVGVVIYYYMDRDIKFIYWHQGDVYCVACDNSYLLILAAAGVFGISTIMVSITRGRHGQPASVANRLIGLATVLPLLGSLIVVLLS